MGAGQSENKRKSARTVPQRTSASVGGVPASKVTGGGKKR